MKIVGAILHQPANVPGVMAPNIYINPKKVPGVELRWEEGLGLYIKIKNRTGFFPAAAIAWVETEEEQKKSKKED